jgi:hypothetical protein
MADTEYVSSHLPDSAVSFHQLEADMIVECRGGSWYVLRPVELLTTDNMGARVQCIPIY